MAKRARTKLRAKLLGATLEVEGPDRVVAACHRAFVAGLTGSAMPADRAAKGTLAAGITAVLIEEGGPLRAGEIAQRLADYGYNPGPTTVQAIARRVTSCCTRPGCEKFVSCGKEVGWALNE